MKKAAICLSCKKVKLDGIVSFSEVNFCPYCRSQDLLKIYFEVA